MASGLRLNRRQCLVALAAGGLVPSAVMAAAASTPTVLRRWATGNKTLAPLTWLDGQVFFGGEHHLGRIDPNQDALVWQVPHRLSSNAVYRPRVAGQTVVTGGLHELGAWQIDNGKPSWLHKARIQMGTPHVTPPMTFVGDGHEMLALSNADGHVVWRFASTLDTLASYAPVLVGGTLLFGPGNGVLHALDATDGHVKWVLDDSAQWQYTRQLYVSGDTLVAGTYTELLYGISLTTGKVLWRFKAGNFINSHHVFGDTAYLWSPTGWVYAIDIHTGQVRWRHQTSRYGNRSTNWGHMMAELVVHGGLLHALDMTHVLHVLDVESGHEVQRVPFTQNLRPTVVPLPGAHAMLATETGDVIHVKW